MLVRDVKEMLKEKIDEFKSACDCGLIAFCMIMLTGCGNPAEEVLKEIETGDAAKAQQIYEKKVSGDSSAEKW